VNSVNVIIIITLTEFTETTTVDDHDGILSKRKLMPILPTFYTITLIIDVDWIPAPTQLKKSFLNLLMVELLIQTRYADSELQLSTLCC